MTNFCGIISKEKAKEPITSDPCRLTYRELESLTIQLTDEVPNMEDIFRRQTIKVLENETKVLNSCTLVSRSSFLMADALTKIQQIEAEIKVVSFDLDVLEFFMQMLESQVTELSPDNVDCQRFPLYQSLLGIICLVDNNKDSMEQYFEEYNDFLKLYRQKNVPTTILDHHVKILQNIKAHLDDLDRVNETVGGFFCKLEHKKLDVKYYE